MVNVNDFKNELPQGELLDAIFKRQTELMDKYDPLEEKNTGLTFPHGIFDLNDPRSQWRLKDFAWRVTEELAEATECAYEEDQTHFLEELIDALHFFIEMSIHSGFTPNTLGETIYAFDAQPNLLQRLFVDAQLPPNHQDSVIEILAWGVVENVGLAMNCLKNKPWKQTQMITDKARYAECMIKAFKALIMLLKAAGFDAESLTRMYLNKSDVNRFRIRSKY